MLRPRIAMAGPLAHRVGGAVIGAGYFRGGRPAQAVPGWVRRSAGSCSARPGYRSGSRCRCPAGARRPGPDRPGPVRTRHRVAVRDRPGRARHPAPGEVPGGSRADRQPHRPLNDVITEIRTAVFDLYTDPADTPRLGGALHDIVQAITADTEPRKEQRQDERDHLRQRQHGHRRGRHRRGGGRGPATFEIATELIRPGGPVATVGVHGEVGGTQTPGPVDHGHRDHHWTGQRHHDVTPMLLKLVAKASQRRRSRDHPFPFDRIIDADINFVRAAETKAFKVVGHHTLTPAADPRLRKLVRAEHRLKRTTA